MEISVTIFDMGLDGSSEIASFSLGAWWRRANSIVLSFRGKIKTNKISS